jgi:hypothetical protein
MSQSPWWHPSDDDLGWDEPLPVIIRLAPDYSASLRCGGEASAISTGVLSRLILYTKGSSGARQFRRISVRLRLMVYIVASPDA